MSLEKRGNIYYAAFMIKGHRVHRSTGKTSKAAAARVEKQLRKELMEQLFGPPKPTKPAPKQDLRLEQAAARIYDERWKDRRCGKEQFKRMVYLAKILGNPFLSMINEETLEQIKAKLAKWGRAKSTINRYLAHVRTILISARLDWKLPVELPRFRMEREPQGRIRVISDEEELTILNALRDRPNQNPQDAELCRCFPEYAELFEVLLDTGMRLGEALAMTYEDNIDLTHKLIHLHPDQTKSSKPRSVPMTHRVFDILSKRRNGPRPFPWHNNTLRAAWRFVRKVTGINDKEFVIHAFRHTCASRLIRREVPLYTVSKLLGHSSIKVTERYAHLATAELEEAIKKLNKPQVAREEA
jgi:integrase